MRRLLQWILMLLVCLAPRGRAGGGSADTAIVNAGASIQSALDAHTPGGTRPLVIFVRNGSYQEKLWIRRSRVAIVGEEREQTRIVTAVLREEWRREHGDSDWGAATVNIDTGVTDITLANLTVLNTHGALHGTHDKHAFAIRGAGTRIMLLHCRVASDGGDALSLWNRDNGMYYHADCDFEGWVDYVCPRGWCYITGSRFFGHNTASASLWHDGSADRRQKLVIVDSYFDGVAGFPLGRHHRDGQMVFLRCLFSANMADRPIALPPSAPAPWQWGTRHYFFACHREGGDFAWFRDNLQEAEGHPTEDSVTARWTFDGLWDPEGAMPSLLPFAFLPSPRARASAVRADSVTLSWTPGRDAMRHRVFLGTSEQLTPAADTETPHCLLTGLREGTTYFWSVEEVTDHGTVAGPLWSFTTRPRER